MSKVDSKTFTKKKNENDNTVQKMLKSTMLLLSKNALHSYFCEYHGRDIPDLEGETAFTEQYGMVPNKWMVKIYQACTKYHNTVYMFGDSNQCDPVEDGSQIHYDYMSSVTMKEMCPNRQYLEYTEDSSRYDKKTYSILDKFLYTGKVKDKFSPIGQYYKNICYLNTTRRRVTKECCDAFIQDIDYVEVHFKYNGLVERYNIAAGMPIIVTQNLKKYIMFNMMEFVIEDMDVEGALVNNTWFDMNEFRSSFIPAFCSTVYKYQGADINEPYNIYDVNCMDKKQLYTALSRTTKYEYIHLDNQLLNNHYKPRPQPMLERVNSYYNCDYLFGKVY